MGIWLLNLARLLINASNCIVGLSDALEKRGGDSVINTTTNCQVTCCNQGGTDEKERTYIRANTLLLDKLENIQTTLKLGLSRRSKWSRAFTD